MPNCMNCRVIITIRQSTTFEFLDIQGSFHEGTLPVEKRSDNEYEEEFRDVSFRYPGREEYALRHFNLKLRIGERMAVVGRNGSGKTTMIKRLCRLDEPTAVLDPVAEYEVYSAFDEMVQGKTAIYISHRLSSCRFCDDIVVFDQGEAVQRGSHGALMADREGLYYALYTAQAQYYESNAGQKAEC